MKGIIYLHKNKINGKCYIGSTTQRPSRRWRKSDESYNSYKSCKSFYRALNKYGWDNFETTVLESGIRFEDISTKEEFYINKYNSMAPAGYNIKIHIDGRQAISEETKKKISRSKVGKKMNNIPHNKIEHVFIDGVESKQCTDCNQIFPLSNFNKNVRVYDNLMRSCKPCHVASSRKYRKKERLSEEDLKKSYKDRKTTSRPFIGVSESGQKIIFKSGMEASRNGFDKTSIRRSILRSRPYKGFIWKYHDDPTRVFARKCEIKVISPFNERTFLETFHKQGYIPSKLCYGLYFKGDLVQIMSFGHSRFDKAYDWELFRLCSKEGTIVVGGASKLLSYFIKHNSPKSLMTYADKGYSKAGDVYEKIGFKYIKDTQKGYFYKKGSKVLSRYQCQKHKLPRILGDLFDPNKTERQNMIDAGYKHVETPGNRVFEFIFERN